MKHAISAIGGLLLYGASAAYCNPLWVCAIGDATSGATLSKFSINGKFLVDEATRDFAKQWGFGLEGTRLSPTTKSD